MIITLNSHHASVIEWVSAYARVDPSATSSSHVFSPMQQNPDFESSMRQHMSKHICPAC